MVLAGGFIDWNLRFGRESTIRSQLGHLQVFRPGYVESGRADPFRYLLPSSGRELEAIEALPAVKAVAPRLSISGLISLGDATISFIGDGVDPQRESTLAQALTIRSGANLSPDDPTGLILGEGLAANLDARVGDAVVLVATTATGGVNAVEGRVRGIFATITKAYDDAAIRVPITTARSLLRASGAHHWAILLDDTERTEQALSAIREKLAGKPLQIVPWTELADFYNKTAALFGRQMAVMKAIIAAIIVLSISNTMTMSVLERTAEIGTSMALGYRRRSILVGFLVEGAVLGLIGGLVGALAGVVLALLISWVGIPMPAPPGMASGYTAEIMLSVPRLVEAVSIATLATLLASTYPAWKASRLPIVDALRYAR